MFLDDALYLKVNQSKIDKPEDFQTLVNELYKMCEDYYKPKLFLLLGHPYKEVTQVMDKTFKFWDMFIEKLDKENWAFVDILKECSYKQAFMSNENLKEVYEKGK